MRISRRRSLLLLHGLLCATLLSAATGCVVIDAKPPRHVEIYASRHHRDKDRMPERDRDCDEREAARRQR